MSTEAYRKINVLSMVFLLGMMLGALAVFLHDIVDQGTTPRETLEAQVQLNEQTSQEKRRDWADTQTLRIDYIRDERTGLCFAFYGYNNAPSLAEVPYEKVKHVLLNPIIKAEKGGSRRGHPSE